MNPSHAAALAFGAALAGCVGVPVDELLASTGIVAELPLESGARVEAARFSAGRAGEWREFRRNVLEDYRLAFGQEPWDIVAVGVMTDASNTREKASAQYGDISFRPAE